MELTDLLARIIHCNSISSINPSIDQGNRDVIDLLANTLGDLGFAIEIMDLGPMAKQPFSAKRARQPLVRPWHLRYERLLPPGYRGL